MTLKTRELESPDLEIDHEGRRTHHMGEDGFTLNPPWGRVSNLRDMFELGFRWANTIPSIGKTSETNVYHRYKARIEIIHINPRDNTQEVYTNDHAYLDGGQVVALFPNQILYHMGVNNPPLVEFTPVRVGEMELPHAKVIDLVTGVSRLIRDEKANNQQGNIDQVDYKWAETDNRLPGRVIRIYVLLSATA